jgi:hypothetical protein
VHIAGSSMVSGGKRLKNPNQDKLKQANKPNAQFTLLTLLFTMYKINLPNDTVMLHSHLNEVRN